MKAKIWNYSEWINQTDIDILKNCYQEKLEDAGFEVVGYAEHRFQPYGFSCVWLIAESHFAIHTFPEENKTYIELSSCSQTKYDKFIKNKQ